MMRRRPPGPSPRPPRANAPRHRPPRPSWPLQASLPPAALRGPTRAQHARALQSRKPHARARRAAIASPSIGQRTTNGST
eukprot:4831805-Pleurochrysis_carterae.AAC.1